jgi:hypothetical protein
MLGLFGAPFSLLGGGDSGRNAFRLPVVELFDPVPQLFQALHLILKLAPFFLGGDNNAGRNVFQSYGTVGFVDMLPSFSASAELSHFTLFKEFGVGIWKDNLRLHN